jgi:hypothetical protein
MMVLYGGILDAHEWQGGEPIERILEHAGSEGQRGARALRLWDTLPQCPSPEWIERESDIGSFYVVEVILPHSEAELACYVVPEEQRRGEGKMWVIPSYVLRGCPTRVISLDVARHILGRDGEVTVQEWDQAHAVCQRPGSTINCHQCGTANPYGDLYCAHCRAELRESAQEN